MKVIILSGGLGTRLSEETSDKPKPMVTIGGKPILWHIMKIFATQGYTDFVIATGYKGEVIKDWIPSIEEPWNVTALDTGENTQTGGRIKRCVRTFDSAHYFVTYGDGLANVDLSKLLSVHNESKSEVTVTAVRPPARFGVLKIEGSKVTRFGEKTHTDAGWINGGFFVVNRDIENWIEEDKTLFETGPLPRLALSGKLSAYKHFGFWQPMDTLRERDLLNDLAKRNPPPWLD